MKKHDIMPEISLRTTVIACVLLAVVGWGIGVNGAILATILSITMCFLMVYGTMEFNSIFYAAMFVCNAIGLTAGWIVYLIYHGWTVEIGQGIIKFIKLLLPS